MRFQCIYANAKNLQNQIVVKIFKTLCGVWAASPACVVNFLFKNLKIKTMAAGQPRYLHCRDVLWNKD